MLESTGSEKQGRQVLDPECITDSLNEVSSPPEKSNRSPPGIPFGILIPLNWNKETAEARKPWFSLFLQNPPWESYPPGTRVRKKHPYHQRWRIWGQEICINKSCFSALIYYLKSTLLCPVNSSPVFFFFFLFFCRECGSNLRCEPLVFGASFWIFFPVFLSL